MIGHRSVGVVLNHNLTIDLNHNNLLAGMRNPQRYLRRTDGKLSADGLFIIYITGGSNQEPF